MQYNLLDHVTGILSEQFPDVKGECIYDPATVFSECPWVYRWLFMLEGKPRYVAIRADPLVATEEELTKRVMEAVKTFRRKLNET